MSRIMRWVTMGVWGCILVAVPQAQGNPINITLGGVGDEAAQATDLGNFGDATVLNWLKHAVEIYNQGKGEKEQLPANGITAVATGLEDGAGGDRITLDLIYGAYDYLFLHWGGKGGGWVQAFYITGLSGSYDFDNSRIADGEGHPKVGGLSSYSFYDPPSPGGPNVVPDGGTTLLLLGATLCCVGLIRRKLRTA